MNPVQAPGNGPAEDKPSSSVHASAVHASSVHASAVVLGESAVLVRGAAGSGKTSLCLALIAAARQQGRFSRLVGDDRVLLQVRHGRVLVRAVPALAGLVERRGLGLAPVPHEPSARVTLVVDLVGSTPDRLPEPEALVTEIGGVALPRLTCSRAEGDVMLVLAALDLFAGDGPGP